MDAPLGLALSRLLPFLLQGTTELLAALLGRLLSETPAPLQPLVTWSMTEDTAANLCGVVATGREVGAPRGSLKLGITQMFCMNPSHVVSKPFKNISGERGYPSFLHVVGLFCLENVVALNGAQGSTDQEQLSVCICCTGRCVTSLHPWLHRHYQQLARAEAVFCCCS